MAWRTRHYVARCAVPADFNNLLWIDFEAQSEVSITDVGSYAYAAHPSTVPLCAAWAIGAGPVQLWKEGEMVPPEWAAHRDSTWVAHNHETEQELLRQKFGLVIDKWIDTASLASAAGMPRNLEDVAESLHLPVGKGDRAAMMQVSRPRKPSKDNPAKFWRPETRPDLFERLYAYCMNDVEVMRNIFRALPPYHWVWPPREEKLHDVTRRMNQVGVQVDRAGIEAAISAVKEHEKKLRAEFDSIMPGVNPKSPVVVARTLGLPNVAKDTLRDELKDKNHNPETLRAMEILRILNTAATSKLKAFKSRSPNGTLNGSMVFHGAGTGRWSSMGVQLHNLLRGLAHETPDWPAIDTSDNAMDLAFNALHAGALCELYPNPIRTIASMMKGFILGPLLTGDYSQIEARVLAKLAGQTDLLDAFAKKRDPYKAMASRIYAKAVDVITKSERFMGKQAVLGCGYGLGKNGFRYMLKTTYDVDIPVEESEKVVATYRQANQKIVSFWWALERLAKKTVLEQPQTFMTSPDTPGIGMRTYRRWLCIRIPSGRVLWYFEPELEPDEKGMTLFYSGRDTKRGGRWGRIKLYGGKLAGHVTQATARDIMADAKLRLVEAGFTLVLTVHDELVAKASDPENPDETRLFEKLLREPPAWWRDIPLDVEVQWARRYQK